MAQGSIQTTLCPRCANSIAKDTLTCPYCKADLMLVIEPEWPRHVEVVDEPKRASAKAKLPLKSKVILVLGLGVFALGVYLVGDDVERHDFRPQLAEQQRVLQEKEERIKALESQLAKLRQDNRGTGKELEQLKAKLKESQSNLAAVQNKLTSANREVARLSASQVAAAPRPAARTNNYNPSPAPPVTLRPSRSSEPRLYETVRTTPIYEEPANSSRVVAQVGRGTQITVIGSGGGWLEIRSKHGKPPGFIHADDAMFLSKAN